MAGTALADAAIRAQVFDELVDAILIADDERRYVDVNPAACALFGRTREELLAMRVDDVMPKVPGLDTADAWRRFLAEGSQQGELPLRRGEETIIVEFRARARIAPNRHMSVLRDVTARVRAAEAAQRREAEFRRLADHLPYLVARFDREHRHVYVNQAVERVLGTKPEAFLGKTNEELGLPAENVREWNAMLDAAFAGEEVAGEFTITDALQKRRTFESRVVPERSASGAIDSALAVVREVTAERAALAAYDESTRLANNARAILDAFLMAAPVGFAILDRDLRFQVINPTLAAMNGLPIDAHIGRTPMEILPGLAAEFIREHAADVLSTGKPLANLELEGETPAAPGVKRTWVEHWYPVRVDREIIGVGIVVEEVTEKRRADAQLREASELRDRLMAIVSHDLRNPLSAITTAASMIGMNGEAPRQVVNLASRILGSSRRMARLIEQLLDFVRVDQGGGLAVDRAPMELTTAVERAIDEAGLAFPDAVVALDVEGSSVGHWDGDRISQALSNLLGNAIQHGDGRVHVRIDGRAPQHVHVTIENAGAPIPAELLPVIFDPFRRASGGYARRTGLGLGLFITKSILESHGGSIAVRSDEHGTAFSFTLPRR